MVAACIGWVQQQDGPDVHAMQVAMCILQCAILISTSG